MFPILNPPSSSLPVPSLWVIPVHMLENVIFSMIPFAVKSNNFVSKKYTLKSYYFLTLLKTKILATSAITSWQIDKEQVETVTNFIFLGSKIHVDSDCGRKTNRYLCLERKAMINLDRRQPRWMVRGGRREEGSGWGTRVYLWRIHVDVWQNQYNIVK